MKGLLYLEDLTCRQTLAITSHRVLASDLNEHETVYGGRLLEMLDGTASISAIRLARASNVTASVDGLNFLAPFILNDSLCIESYVSGVGSRSIEVFAKIIGEHLTTGERFLGLTAFLTFVVPDKQIILPQITPITEEEKIICAGYKDRKLEKSKKFARQKELNRHISLHLPWDKN